MSLPRESRPIRVVIQQPVLSHYRVPVFRELARRPGIDLKVVYGDEAGISNAKPDGFRAEFVKLHDIHVFGSLLRFHPAQYRYCTREQADVVVHSWSMRYATQLPGLMRARWNDLGVVLWGHGYSKADSRLRIWGRTTLLGFADSVLFYNYSAAQTLIDSGRLRPERAFVALNTLDLAPAREVAERWRAEPRKLARFRFENGLDSGPVVLFVSRLYEANRTDLLVRAVVPLARRFSNLKVVIIGDGPDAARLRRIASDLGVEGTVRFVGALYGEENIAPWFLSADVFCYPTNIGLSLIHAMSYGLPVVTGDRIGAHNPEIEAFRDGVNGLFFREKDVDSLSESLGAILSDPGLKRRLSEAALSTVTNDFTIEKMVDGMEAAIRCAAVNHGL
ncbi:GDP-mannose-dependent alpha-(1-6)-phosphatidylinositol monomannoside mannosyltransferase [Phycisphaerales bacterium]|nr:GDP-mannose-dependent alpha-(1-6)-phosphatidylinositol monomannoside mannosyltransferase [Phycisphaerales bacterium]